MGRDRGAASIYAVIAMAALLLVTGVVGAAMELARAQHQAAAAADLAALAGAGAASDGADACAAARRVAQANAARLTSCEVSQSVVEVRVEVRSPELWGKTWTIPGRARAGPADSLTSSVTRGAPTENAFARRDPADLLAPGSARSAAATETAR